MEIFQIEILQFEVSQFEVSQFEFSQFERSHSDIKYEIVKVHFKIFVNIKHPDIKTISYFISGCFYDSYAFYFFCYFSYLPEQAAPVP